MPISPARASTAGKSFRPSRWRRSGSGCSATARGRPTAPSARNRGSPRATGRAGRRPGSLAGRRANFAGDRDRRGRGGERRDGDARIEALDQLLEHEGRAGERRVEGGGEARAGARREQRPAVAPVEAGRPADGLGEGRPHLHRQALAAERQTRADRQHAADELDRHKQERRRRRCAASIASTWGMPLPPRMARTAHQQGGAVAAAAQPTMRSNPVHGSAPHIAGRARRSRSAASSATRNSPPTTPARRRRRWRNCQREKAGTVGNQRRILQLEEVCADVFFGGSEPKVLRMFSNSTRSRSPQAARTMDDEFGDQIVCQITRACCGMKIKMAPLSKVGSTFEAQRVTDSPEIIVDIKRPLGVVSAIANASPTLVSKMDQAPSHLTIYGTSASAGPVKKSLPRTAMPALWLKSRLQSNLRNSSAYGLELTVSPKIVWPRPRLTFARKRWEKSA